jgi:hypothetical protein
MHPNYQRVAAGQHGQGSLRRLASQAKAGPDDFLKTFISPQPVTISQAIEGYQMVNLCRRF